MPGIIRAFNITKSGLQLQETNIAIKSQNLAAQGVDGYKRQYLVAQDLPYQDVSMVGAPTSASGTVNTTGLSIGSGVKAAAIYRSFTDGDLVNTGNGLDLAISGDGFFQITMPDGTHAYTRAGIFQLNGTGQLTTASGYPVAPGITIPPTANGIKITEDGQVVVEITGQTAPQVVGQLQLSTFVNPSGLRALGDNLFAETPASGTPDTGTPTTNKRGSIRQGWRESSNVNPVEEITDLIKIQRAYEMLTKVLNTGDAMMEAANRVT
jgi:flagellar basal-body rod protein FlgG